MHACRSDQVQISTAWHAYHINSLTADTYTHVAVPDDHNQAAAYLCAIDQQVWDLCRQDQRLIL